MSSTIAVMQPYFFPYIGYFQLINSVDKFIIYDDVNFINRGWVNRNNLLSNGNKLLVTVPLKKSSQNKLINEVEISYDVEWKGKLIKVFESLYKKSPYFNEVIELIGRIFENDFKYISELNLISIKSICVYLDIKTEILNTTCFFENRDLKGQDRIIDICKRENADNYINPIGGIELYDRSLFKLNGIELKFIKSNILEYNQYKFDFVPWLSILDVLFFNGKAKTKLMLKEYQLI